MNVLIIVHFHIHCRFAYFGEMIRFNYYHMIMIMHLFIIKENGKSVRKIMADENQKP